MLAFRQENSGYSLDSRSDAGLLTWRAIVRALEGSKDLTRKESVFREFMKRVNLMGAGIAFEVWSSDDIDVFMDRCLEQMLAAA